MMKNFEKRISDLEKQSKKLGLGRDFVIEFFETAMAMEASIPASLDPEEEALRRDKLSKPLSDHEKDLLRKNWICIFQGKQPYKKQFERWNPTQTEIAEVRKAVRELRDE